MNATPKLYWPEFKRKFKKEPEMKDPKVVDRDREKYYRDYISRMTHLVIVLVICLTSVNRSQNKH